MAEEAGVGDNKQPTKANGQDGGPRSNGDKPSKPQQSAEQQDQNKAQGGDSPAPSSVEEKGEQRGRNGQKKPLAGWLILAGTLLLAVMAATLAITRAVLNPRTDDAEVFANFIATAPQVEGPISQLPIRDNAFVKTGDLLFTIDDRPYKYALQRALSEQASLEGQIEDRRRAINSQISGVHVARANIESAASSRNAAAATIAEAEANVVDAKASLRSTEADRRYAADNLHRLEPLLLQQYVTVDQVDQARTLLETRTRAVQQAEAQVALAEARVRSERSRFEQSDADVEQRRAQRDQAANGVETLEPLTNQREERAAAVRLAQYNLNNCKVYAPFDGYITNLTTSLGAYVHVGAEVFTLIDAREWWVIANFRETQLKHVVKGSPADVFLLSRETLPLHGTVDSIGHGVTPDPSVVGAITPGLPAVQRTLSWVHLAARYPVRIRIEAAPPGLLRIGQSAVAVVHPRPGTGN